MRYPNPLGTARGHTLVELLFVLTLLGVGASALVPTARRLSDRVRVVEARESIARGLLRARAAGVSAGGSTVTVFADPGRVRVSVGAATLYDVRLGDRRTRVILAGTRDSLQLRFDGLGIGRFTTATVSLRRGDAETGLVLSSYGRVRRR